MKISLATSLHLDHSAMTINHRAGDPIPLQSFIPTGLLCLKAYSEAQGVPADIRVTEVNGVINGGRVPNDHDFFARLASDVAHPEDRLVGLMTDADSLHHTVVLADEIKRQAPDILVCLGGPGSSPLAHDLLERFPAIDYVVRGEGEETFAELLMHLDEERAPLGVAGLSWRSPGGAIVDNKPRPVIRAIDTLPIPQLTADGVTAASAVYVDVGRGCPFSCHFCATAPFWDRRYRMKSIDRILEELRLLRAAGRDHVSFSHDIFTCNRVWTREFCDQMMATPPGLTWSCSTRTDTIDDGLLEMMAAAGCAEIYYGIETGSSSMQNAIHKNLDIERCRRIVKKTADVGIRPVTGFIVGYPTETRASLAETLNRFFEFLEIGGHRAHLFTLCPFADAPMYRDGNPIDRPAGYFEPPLIASELAKAAAVSAVHPDVFSSLWRYATPALPSDLVDASEEISSRLVVLKVLWPHLLRHYADALDWYERWARWIRERNQTRRPGTRMPCIGEVDDVLDFVQDELGRLGLTDTGLSLLVQYERAKLAATRTLPPEHEWSRALDRESEVDLEGWVVASAPMRIVKIDGDLAAALGGRRSQQAVTWVALVRRNDVELEAVQVGEVHARLLAQLDAPRAVRDLLHDEAGTDAADVLRRLVEAGLVARSRREVGFTAEPVGPVGAIWRE
jgi:radical SAM superfamily enzyme YgiQ (UPF0313 family)